MVNAPSFFNVLWRIVQPLIPAATKERLFVLRNMKVRRYYRADTCIISGYPFPSGAQLAAAASM